MRVRIEAEIEVPSVEEAYYVTIHLEGNRLPWDEVVSAEAVAEEPDNT